MNNYTNHSTKQIIAALKYYSEPGNNTHDLRHLLTEAAERLRDATEPEETPYFTTQEAADYLDLNRQTIGRYGKRGKLTLTGKHARGKGHQTLWLKSEIKALRPTCQECQGTVRVRHWRCPHCGANLKT